MEELTDRDNQQPFREQFGNLICLFQRQLFYLFVLEVVLLVLSLFALLFIEPGTDSHVILQIDLFFLGLLTTGTLGTLFICSRRDSE